MSLFAMLAADDITRTPSKFWPEGYEMLFGIPASVLVFFLLWKFAGPAVKKGMAARTAKIQGELDAGEADRVAAEAEAAQIRQAKGDIAAERDRLLADADAQAATLLEDGKARLGQELVELDVRAEAEIVAAASRSGDELRAEIARLSAAAVELVVTGTLDESTHQELIENFIAKVGAGISV
ncbi:MAG: F-type H+-transporting ATPase subunit b [Ilumatobacteraceae bacterium]|jgi:F-type H+-transporting ATPase subunit b|nr:F-type H+-transporting ATPase subunit b [Ilumatobacteraceae bacterium]